MVRINYIRQFVYFAVYVLIQLPLLYKAVLFNQAFAFFYLGFLLMLPYGMSRSVGMLIAFFTGLLIDVFSSTPGLHASACIFVVFVKDYWFLFSVGDPEDEINLSWGNLGLWGLFRYQFPLILTHHLIIFAIENAGFISVGALLSKVILSAGYSFVIIASLAYLSAPKSSRS